MFDSVINRNDEPDIVHSFLGIYEYTFGQPTMSSPAPPAAWAAEI